MRRLYNRAVYHRQYSNRGWVGALFLGSLEMGAEDSVDSLPLGGFVRAEIGETKYDSGPWGSGVRFVGMSGTDKTLLRGKAAAEGLLLIYGSGAALVLRRT